MADNKKKNPFDAHTHTFTGYNTAAQTVYPNSGTTYPITSQPYTQPTWTTAPNVTRPALFDQMAGAQDYIDEVDDIAGLLGVPEGGKGIQVMGKSGKSYSLLAIIKSHLDLMQQLHILAVHTKRLDPDDR